MILPEPEKIQPRHFSACLRARELEQRPLATDAALAADLMQGKVDLATPGILATLRRMALDKLTADMPKYPSLALARAQWEGN